MAIADYSQGIYFMPNDSQFYYNRGIAYADNGNLDLALADYNKAIALNPQYVKAFVNRSNVFFKRNSLIQHWQT